MSRRHPDRPRRRSTITIPTGVGPHVRLVFAEMQRQRITYDSVEERSGVLRATLKAWRSKNAPGLTSIEAVLGALEWDFLPIPRARSLAPDLVADLRSVAERHRMPLDATIQALVEIVSGLDARRESIPDNRRAIVVHPIPRRAPDQMQFATLQ